MDHQFDLFDTKTLIKFSAWMHLVVLWTNFIDVFSRRRVFLFGFCCCCKRISIEFEQSNSFIHLGVFVAVISYCWTLTSKYLTIKYDNSNLLCSIWMRVFVAITNISILNWEPLVHEFKLSHQVIGIITFFVDRCWCCFLVLA